MATLSPKRLGHSRRHGKRPPLAHPMLKSSPARALCGPLDSATRSAPGCGGSPGLPVARTTIGPTAGSLAWPCQDGLGGHGKGAWQAGPCGRGRQPLRWQGRRQRQRRLAGRALRPAGVYRTPPAAAAAGVYTPYYPLRPPHAQGRPVSAAGRRLRPGRPCRPVAGDAAVAGAR